VNSSVFNLCLNTGSVGDDEMKVGKLFQTRAAVTGNARSRIECFGSGMTMIEFAVENLSADRYGGALPSWQRKRALPDGMLFSPELLTNGSRGVAECSTD